MVAPAAALIRELIGDGLSPRAAKRIAQVITDQGSDSGTYSGRGAMRPTTRTPRPATLTMVSIFQSGSAWNDQGGTAGHTAAADTGDYEYGSQSFAVTTPAAGGANATTRVTGLTAVDVSAKHFALLVKVDNPTALGNIILTVGNGAFTNFVQYNAVYGNSNAVFATTRAGSWQWVYFTKAEQVAVGGTGTACLTAVTDWQLRVNGGAASTVTAKFNGLGYFTPAPAFPNGCVSLTFDDVYSTQATLAAAYMDRYGHAGTAFVIADQVDTAGKLTSAQLNDLHGKHNWDIGGHAFTIAAHNAGLSTLSAQAIDDELFGLRQWLATRGYKGHDLFAYPLGDENDSVNQSVGRYFSFARLVTRQPYQTVTVGGQNMRVRAYSIDAAATTAATITALIDSAYANGWWLILVFHEIRNGDASTATQWNIANFQTVDDYCVTKGIPVRTVSEVLAAT